MVKVIRRTDLGTDVAVNPVTGQLAYNKRDADGVSQLYTDGVLVETDGSYSQQPYQYRHKHQQTWSPGGEALMFTAVDGRYNSPWWQGRAQEWVQAINGWHSDIYIYVAGTPPLWVKCTDTFKYSVPCGVLYPRFSPDGCEVLWAELLRYDAGSEFGNWGLRRAGVVRSDWGVGFTLDEEDVTPPGNADVSLQEPHGWTPDGLSYLVCSHYGLALPPLGLDLFRVRESDGEVTNITGEVGQPRTWNEHAHFSPNGQDMAYMSSVPYVWDGKRKDTLKTEVVLARPDDSIEVLTGFNKVGSGHYSSQKSLAYPTGFSPDGKLLYVTQVMAGINYPERRSWVVELEGV